MSELMRIKMNWEDVQYSIGPLDIFPLGHAYKIRGQQVQGYLDFECTYDPAPAYPPDILTLIAQNEYGQARILLTASVEWIGVGHARIHEDMYWRLYFRGRVIREAEILGSWSPDSNFGDDDD